MTTPHIADNLPRLLTGEASRQDVLIAARHLRECTDCQQELVSAVVSHASLASAQRFAPELMALHAEQLLAEPAEHTDRDEPEALPDLSAVFARARQEATAPTPAAKPRFTRGRLAAAAAVAGLIIGGGGVGLGIGLGGSGPSGQAVALSPYGAGSHEASARLSSTSLTIDATALPKLDAQHRYEVWLTNAARTQMQPVGWIGANGKADVTLPRELIEQFDAIEVSVQQVDAANYQYSGTSVLRGSFSS